MSMVGFPLLLIALAICNIIIFLMPSVSFSATLVTLPLMSGVGWAVTLSDVLLALGIVMLLFEVMKGARPGAKYLTDHLLALIVFAGTAAEFVLLPQFGTSTFFLLTLLTLADFLSGIALRTRRSRAAAPTAKARPRNEPAAEPRYDPVPPTTEPVAAPAARVESEAGPSRTHEPSPEIQSPGIQPGTGTPSTPGDPQR